MEPTSRYFNFESARSRFGDRVDRYREFLYQRDPLADNTVTALAALPAGRGAKFLKTALDEGIEAVPDAPEALKALFAQVDRVPFWVNWERIDRGGFAFRRAAVPVLLMLALYSLPTMYSSPAGSKPLVATKQLVDRAGQRLGETSAFVRLTCSPGGLKRFGDGFKINLKVRLMHAQVRRLLLRSGRWDEAWAMPINQAHMAGTLIAISAGVILKLQEIGFEFSPDEIDDMLHLWRYSGYLSGVEEELICSTLSDAQQLSEIILAIEGAPDEDSKALVQALREMRSPLPESVDFPLTQEALRSLTRSLLGEEVANSLDIPKTDFPPVIPIANAVLGASSWVQLTVPGGRELFEYLGREFWGFAEGMTFKSASEPPKKGEREQ